MIFKSNAAFRFLSLFLAFFLLLGSFAGCFFDSGLGSAGAWGGHIYLASKNRGNCEELTGSVCLSFVFLSDSVSKWDSVLLEDAKSRISESVQSLNRESESFGVSLSVSYYCAEVTLSEEAAREKYAVWMDMAVQSLGYDSVDAAQRSLEDSGGYTAVPFLFVQNKAGRSFARITTADTGAEAVVLYFDDLNSGVFRHELFHVFGAKDFYYPAEVQQSAKTHLANSIMQDSQEGTVDGLTAYLIGWTDTLSPSAESFLEETALVTEEDVAKAHEQDTLTGYGTKQWGDDVYTGNLVYGVAHGEGTITFASGDTYTGDWVNGKRTGYGVYTWANGDRYEGSWIDDNRTGKGVLIWANGDRYEGDWVNDTRTGKGTLIWGNGDRYEGDWVDGRRTGKGILTWANGDRYEGDFIDGIRFGKGILKWAGGDVYDGDWVDGVRSGKGTYLWASGNRYDGGFLNGELHGNGVLTYASGTVRSGVWEAGEFIG